MEALSRRVALALLLGLAAAAHAAGGDPLAEASAAATAHQSRLVWLTARDPATCKRELAQLAAVNGAGGGSSADQRRRLLDARQRAVEELRALARLKVPADVADAAAREAKRLDALRATLEPARPPAAIRPEHVYYVTPAPPPARGHDGERPPLRWRDGVVTPLPDDAAGTATLVWIDEAQFQDDRALPKAKFDALMRARLASGPPRAEMWSYLDERILSAAVDTTALAATDPAIARAGDEDLQALAARAPKIDTAAARREAAALAVETGKAAELARRAGLAQAAAEFSRWQEHARSFTLRP